ncbi:hypothetical protein BJX68DRAFT_272691 [Aspergillus pseudodeflectus]|uniref:F-box domain-containing protein n=1 Tax=Aspergillus pseudodeflectus TaxID=176178 RepID=A0ABR4JGV2_9EURO
MSGQTLSIDIWRLILEQVEREDLYELCLTSKIFNSVATPLLYRTIPLVALEPDPLGTLPWHKREEPVFTSKGFPLRRQWHLLSRLEDERNDTLRNYVQELDLSTNFGPGQLDHRFLKHLLEDDRLPKLIGRLPNLRRVKLDVEELQTEDVIRAIAQHPRNPELSLQTYISGEKTFYTQAQAARPLPCVTSLQVSVSPFDQRNAENQYVLAAQRLIFNCPNLRSLSLTLWWQYGGCVISAPRYPITTSFQFTGNEVFPPIESLALDGYGNRMSEGEWTHWRDRFNWSKLSSLTLGPQDASGILDRVGGYATALTSLEVSAYVDERTQNRAGLEALLQAFGSLKTLKLDGYICSVKAIAQHKDLEELWLHEDESAAAGRERMVLTVVDLEYLDNECPRLKTLKVDIKRGDDKLPTDVLSKLATGFKNLQSLSLHFELGLPDTKHPITPTINYTSVRSIAQSFFAERKQAALNTDTFTLTLWTGKPGYVSFEKLYTATYEIRLPGGKDSGEVHVRHLEKEELGSPESRPCQRKRNALGVFGNQVFWVTELRKRVEAAVEGPPRE